jgi:hypothetical protein
MQAVGLRYQLFHIINNLCMSRRLRLILTISCGIMAVLIAVSLGLYFALQYEPEFYREALAVKSGEQEEDSDEMLRITASLVSNTKKPGKWKTVLTARQINAWFAVDMMKNHSGALPPNMSDPRVEIEPDRIVLACRHEWGSISTVLTLTIEPFAPKENVLALRIIKARAGLVPMPLGKVLDGISEAARQSEQRLEWRQIGGNPVAMFYVSQSGDSSNMAVKIDTIRLDNGEIYISGTTERK